MTNGYTAPHPAPTSSGERVWQGGPPARYRNLAHLVDSACATHARRKAFTCVVPNGMNGTLTYAQIGQMSDAFAAYLRHDCGLMAGDRVAVQLPNSLAYPIVAFGVLKAGCVLVNTNPLYTPAEMIHQFNDSGAKCLVVVDLFANKLAEVVPQTGLRTVVLAGVPEFFPKVPQSIVRGVQKYWNRTIPPVPSLSVPVLRLRDALAKGEKNGAGVQKFWDDVGPDHIALLQYTGGTTGVPKGAMLSHGNLLANLEQVQAVSAGLMTPNDCVLTALPLYHIFAFTANLMSFFENGARNILIPSPRPIQNVQRAIENYPINWITGVNTLFNALMNEEWFAAYPPKHLRAAIAGGTALHASVARRWQAMTGTPLSEGYGLTEASPLVTFNPLDGRAKPGSIGIEVPGCEVILVDDDGKPVPEGQPGEVIVKGPQVMKGYWNRPEDSAKTVQNGWLFTGDIAVREGDGFLRIVDRKKDLILVSGFNVYPNEIEDVLSKMESVLESAVVPIPDDKTGEAVRAYVVKNPDFAADLTQDDIQRHCRALLTEYKVPKSIIFRDELPKSPIGKILRKDLKAEVRSEFSVERGRSC